MKKAFLFGMVLTLLPLPSFGAEKLTEPEQFGMIAGVAMACGSGKILYMYEEIVSRFFANTAPNEAVEKDMKTQYVRAKVAAFRQQKKKMVDCSDTLNRFAKMPLLQFELYEDGSLKTPDGRYLLPRGQTKFNPQSPRVY